jgi:hypothetical protein
MGDRVAAPDKAVKAFEVMARQHLEKGGWSDVFLKETAAAVSPMKEKLSICDSNADGFGKEDKSIEKAQKDPQLRHRLELQLAYFGQASAAFEKLAAVAMYLLTRKIAHLKTLRGTPALPEPLAGNVLRGLKILKTALDAIAKGNDQWEANSQAIIDRLGKDFDRMAVMARNLLSSLKAEVAKSLAAAQRMKADPTGTNYNIEMDKAGRNVTQILSNIPRLAGNGNALPPSIPANHAQLAQALVPFGNGNLASVPKDASPATVLANITAFNKAIKAVKAGFGV